ncbi:hypothetical protein [Vibrio diazotrophicus]|uniref:hypothetical protein n=1 Tax=Vibrio diazotrophicus TaxID=685 RepID=UPI0015E0CF21|nr:hypothetical protein [Vibrio diazotrophicus]
MSNKYPLDIENVGNDTYIVMSKGLHGAHEFMKAVREAGYDWPLGNPQHVWIKATPDRTGESRALYNIVDQSVRGAFPATYSWEASGDELYQRELYSGERVNPSHYGSFPDYLRGILVDKVVSDVEISQVGSCVEFKVRDFDMAALRDWCKTFLPQTIGYSIEPKDVVE